MPNTTPVTWQVVDAVRTQLTTLTTANGYRTNIGNSVSMERAQAVESDAPFAAVLMPNWDFSDAALANSMRRCTVLVQVTVPATYTSAQEEAHKAAEDVFEVFPIHERVALSGGSECQVVPSSVEILDRPDGIEATVAQITLVVTTFEPIPT